jgi:hypothetical protein
MWDGRQPGRAMRVEGEASKRFGVFGRMSTTIPSSILPNMTRSSRCALIHGGWTTVTRSELMENFSRAPSLMNGQGGKPEAL